MKVLRLIDRWRRMAKAQTIILEESDLLRIKLEFSCIFFKEKISTFLEN